MQLFERTQSWKNTLGQKTKVTQSQTNNLRNSFLNFRSKAEEIVNLLPQNLKELTIHDMRHVDALWQTCDVIGGAKLLSNPLEGFVLGGAFLLHDLGLALASYPGGIKELFEDQNEIKKLSSAQIDQKLRLEHANHAKNLALTRYGGSYLIENTMLREGLGHIVGMIAFSHWQSTDEIDASVELSNQLGVPPTGEYPSDWRIDGKKLAYLLRSCDACQIDGRRAPSFAMTLRKPSGTALLHWLAQNPIQQPYAKDGKLVFTSNRPFTVDNREAWWTFYELAQIADNELRNGEEYFSSNSKSLCVNRIAGIASPKQFSKYVHTKDWIPIDTRPRVSDTQGLIERLGGAALYGTDYKVPLRELIQNARDAVACRRSLEKREQSWGEIRVSFADDDRGKTLVVSDDGIGISEKGFEFLLDFGGQYWKSSLSKEENVGIEKTLFEPAGFFGIGFFSVFMLSRQVKVTTRRFNEAKSMTRVLEFTNGLTERPILRQARLEEERNDPGTDVLVGITQEIEADILRPSQDAADRLMFNEPPSIRDSWTLRDLLEWMCPTLDTSLLVVNADGRSETAIRADDWRTLTNSELALRLMSHRKNPNVVLESHGSRQLVDRIMPVQSSSNQGVTARIAVYNWGDYFSTKIELPFVNTCGGFRAGWSFFPGVTLSEPKTANRLQSTECYQKDHSSIKRWATAQAENISKNSDLTPRQKAGLAFWVRVCDGDLKDLPIAYYLGEFISTLELLQRIQGRDEVRISDELMAFHNNEVTLSSFRSDLQNPAETPSKRKKMLEIKDVFYIPTGRLNLGRPLGDVFDPQGRGSHPQWKRYWYSLWGAAFEAVANAWGCSIDALLSNSDVVTSQHFGMQQEDILRKPGPSNSP